MPEFQSYSKSRKRDTAKHEKSNKPKPKGRQEDSRPVSAHNLFSLKPLPKSKPPKPKKDSNRVRPVHTAAKPQPRSNTPERPEKRKVRPNYIIHRILVTFFLMVLTAILSGTVLFNAERIVIEGKSAYSREEILVAGNIHLGINLPRFKHKQAEEKIISTLTRLDSVTVEKKFPSTIKIVVEPAVRVFSVYSEGMYYGISKNSRIIGVGKNRPQGLIVNGITPQYKEIGDLLEYYYNPEPDLEDEEFVPDSESIAKGAEKIELVFKLVALTEKHALPEITRIDVRDSFDLSLFSGEPGKERIEIKLGSQTELDGKMAVASKIIAEEIAENEKGVLRVTSPWKATFNPK